MSEGLIIRVSGDFKDLESQLKGISKNILSFLGAKGALASAGIAAVTAIATKSIEVGAAFEKQMSVVKAISTASNEELSKMADKAKQMSKSSVFPAKEIGKAYEYMAFAGWEASEMMGALEGIINLAAASGEDLAQVSDIVTDSMTAFGLSSRDTSVMLKNTNHFVDVLAKTAAKSNTNIGKLGQAFKYVAPIAGAAGYSIEDVSLALGLMSDQAIKSGQAGRYLRAIISRLVAPPAEAKKTLDSLGISFSNSEGKARPLYEVLVDLRESMSGLSEEQVIAASRSIAGQNAMSGLLGIVQTTDENFERLHGHLQNTNDAAKEMAEVRIDNLEGRWTKFINKLQVLGIDIYDKMKPGLEKVVGQMDSFVSFLNDRFTGENSFIKTENGLKISLFFTFFSETIQKTLDGIKNSATTFEEYTRKKFGNWISDTKEGVEGWKTSTSGMFLEWSSYAITTITTSLSNTSEKIRSWVGSTAKYISDWAEGTLSNISGWATKAGKWLGDTAFNIGEWATKLTKGQRFSAVGGDIITGIINGMEKKKEDIKSSVNFLGGTIVKAFEKNLKIKSPSKVMREIIGKNISLGIAKGIDDSTINVIDSANKQKLQILNSYSDIFSILRKNFNSRYNSMFSSVPSLSAPILNGNSGNNISTTNSPTINFYGDSNEPDVIARKVRDIFEFGL